MGSPPSTIYPNKLSIEPILIDNEDFRRDPEDIIIGIDYLSYDWNFNYYHDHDSYNNDNSYSSDGDNYGNSGSSNDFDNSETNAVYFLRKMVPVNLFKKNFIQKIHFKKFSKSCYVPKWLTRVLILLYRG